MNPKTHIGTFLFEPMYPGCGTGRVHVGTMPEWVETETEWLWAHDFGEVGKTGDQVFKIYTKKIFKSWVDKGYVIEANEPVEQLTLF